MKKSVMKKWVKALRSGKYKRTTGELCRIDKLGTNYCCLGVLCAISPNKIKMPTGNNLDDQLGVLKWSGLKTPGGTFDNKIEGLSNEYEYDLTYLNDKLKWSFKKIASFIEINYEKL